MEITPETTIGEIVADDFRTAALFTTLGIDFCCKGDRTVQQVCEKKAIEPSVILSQVKQVVSASGGTSADFRTWPEDMLADYIIRKHHTYVEEKIPIILQYLNKLCRVHGERHPELFEINMLFIGSAGDLASHMKKEELVLFPFVRKMVKAREAATVPGIPHFNTVLNPVEMMKEEHTAEGERFEHIARLTNNYTPPADACSTYKVTFAMLKEFEEDLHTHIHLENNILFPRAIALEKELRVIS